MGEQHSPYVWDYNLTEADFSAIVNGQRKIGRLDQRWACVRLIEYAPYQEIISRLGFKTIVKEWPRWRTAVRSSARKRGFDFLADWLPKHHPELLK